MLAALTFMYGCAVVSYAFDLLGFRLRIEGTTTLFTGRYDGDSGLLEAVANTGQYILQGLSVSIQFASRTV